MVEAIDEDNPGGSDRVCDICRIKVCCGHLVEQRLKRVKIVLVNQDDLDSLVGECFSGSQSSESGADDDTRRDRVETTGFGT